MPTPAQPAEHQAYLAANHPLDAVAARARLRREKIAARLALAPDDHRRLSAALEEQLARQVAVLPVGTLAFCWPIRAEFDARPLVARLLAQGWRAVIPTVVERDAAMVFRAWTPQTIMSVDPYGIPVPAAASACAIPDLLLLPLVAFDAAGFRLGYGGGYFDRTLAAMVPRPLAFGVGFELARAPSVCPQRHDIPLDAVVTEAGSSTFARPPDAA